MAGDWIKMRIDLYEDPAVIEMADKLNVREETVVGFCHKIWSWVSRQCHGGSVTGVTLVSLGRVVNLPGFPELMRDVGWLQYDDKGSQPTIEIPKFDRHLSQGAKERALASERKRHGRLNVSRSERDISVTREEKRREEVKTTSLPKVSAKKKLVNEYPEWFEEVWQASPVRGKHRLHKKEALEQANRIPDDQRGNLLSATKAYAKHCRDEDRTPQDLYRWIRDDVWMDFLSESKAKIEKEVYVDPQVKRENELAGIVTRLRKSGWSPERIQHWVHDPAELGVEVSEIVQRIKQEIAKNGVPA